MITLANPVGPNNPYLGGPDTQLDVGAGSNGPRRNRELVPSPSHPEPLLITPLHHRWQNVSRAHQFRDVPRGGMKEHLLACPLLNDSPGFIHEDALAEREGVGQIVRDQYHRDPRAGLDLGQFFSERFSQGKIKRREGLVEQQQTWPHGQGTRQRHPLLLATRQLAWPTMG